MTFNDIIKKYNLKNKATSSIRIQQVLSSLSLNDVGIYLRDGTFESDIVLSIYTHQKGRIGFDINENYFDKYGCVCPKKLSKFSIKRNGFLFIFRKSNTKK